MTVDFSVVLITEKGQDSLVYLLYCLLHYTKMISFSTASFLEETGNISIESFKKKTIHAKDKREGGKKLFTMIHHCKGSACNCLSLLSPWVMDLTGVRVSWVSHFELLICLGMGRAHQPADKALSFPKHGKRNCRNKTQPVVLKGESLISGDWDLQVGGDSPSFATPGKLDMCWIRQEWVKRTPLDIGWIWCWSSYCKALLEAWRFIKQSSE